MAAPLIRNEETDTLASLEERILRAVETVARLRQEKDAIEAKLTAAQTEQDDATRTIADLRTANERLQQELESLRSERKQVRTRIEKLLGQLDTLAT